MAHTLTYVLPTTKFCKSIQYVYMLLRRLGMKIRDRATAKQRAYEYVKSRIIDKSFEEGDFLTEVGIADDLGISRTPVREALVLLEAESFVELLPKKGAYIPRISPRDIREVMEARSLIETFAAERIVERRSELVPKLRESLEVQKKRMMEGKIDEFVEADRAFHYLIVSTAGNNLLARFYEGLRDRQIRMGIRAATYSTQRVEQVLEEHAAVVRAAEEGSPGELREAIRRHLDRTLSVLMAEAIG